MHVGSSLFDIKNLFDLAWIQIIYSLSALQMPYCILKILNGYTLKMRTMEPPSFLPQNRMPHKFLIRIKKHAVGMMGFGHITSYLFYHIDHLGIKVANPVHF